MGHELGGEKIAGLGINGGQLLCFLAFWAIQFYYIVHGMESIRKLETYTAPLKILICFVLLVGAQQGWRLGALLDQPSHSSKAARRPASSERLLAFADGHGGLLGHAGAEHSRLSRASPKRSATR
jgi:cytosine/uracil/thiamine/allantoin permease